MGRLDRRGVGNLGENALPQEWWWQTAGTRRWQLMGRKPVLHLGLMELQLSAVGLVPNVVSAVLGFTNQYDRCKRRRTEPMGRCHSRPPLCGAADELGGFSDFSHPTLAFETKSPCFHRGLCASGGVLYGCVRPEGSFPGLERMQANNRPNL